MTIATAIPAITTAAYILKHILIKAKHNAAVGTIIQFSCTNRYRNGIAAQCHTGQQRQHRFKLGVA